MKKLKLSKSALVFYIMAVLSLGICIFTFYNVTVYIQSLVAAGQLTWSANFGDIFGYYVNNCFTNIVYVFIFVGFGYLISLLKSNHKNQFIESVVEETTEQPEILVEETITNPEIIIEEEIKD